MKALTLWQPWATLVALGAKRIETRDWRTRYRGPLAIHAAKRKMDFLPIGVFARALGQNDIPLGCVVATCDLVDCVRITPKLIKTISSQEYMFGLFSLGRFALMLDNVVMVEPPIPARGSRRLWNWEDTDDCAQIKMILEGSE